MFDWHNYLNLAKELLDANDLKDAKFDEAKLRSSISRAYYAAYWKARIYMECVDNRYIPDDASTHKFVIDHFLGNRSRSRIKYKIGLDLEDIRYWRGEADYGRDATKNLNHLYFTTCRVLKISKRIISNIDQETPR